MSDQKPYSREMTVVVTELDRKAAEAYSKAALEDFRAATIPVVSSASRTARERRDRFQALGHAWSRMAELARGEMP